MTKTMNDPEEHLRQNRRPNKSKVKLEDLIKLGIDASEPSKNVFRIETSIGSVMYYPSSGKWQHKTKTYNGTVEELNKWIRTNC